MPTVTLTARVYNDSHFDLIRKNLKANFEGLKVETRICGVTPRGWVQVSVSGEDEIVALHYLESKIGLCPTSLNEVEKFSNIKGYVTAVDKGKDELAIDVGVASPAGVDAVITLQRLQVQLSDGRKTALKKLVALYGFCDNLPLTLKVLSVDKDGGRIEAELSENQQKLFRDWTASLLDRLLVLGASLEGIKLALEMAGFSRDVVGIESLGMFEYAVVCKFGTDAAGLIPRVGRNLTRAAFSIFSPKRILNFLEEKPALPVSK